MLFVFDVESPFCGWTRFRFYSKIGSAFILIFISVKMLLPLLAQGLIIILGENSSLAALFVQRDIDDDNFPSAKRFYDRIIQEEKVEVERMPFCFAR